MPEKGWFCIVASDVLTRMCTSPIRVAFALYILKRWLDLEVLATGYLFSHPGNNQGHEPVKYTDQTRKLTPRCLISTDLPPMDPIDRNHSNREPEFTASTMPVAERNSEAKSTTAAMKERRFKLGRRVTPSSHPWVSQLTPHRVQSLRSLQA